MPSEYWQSNCAVAASFLHRDDCERRARIGVDHIMWGATTRTSRAPRPFSDEAIRLTFAGVPEPEVRAMLGENAARVYGFDLAELEPLAAQLGPRVTTSRPGSTPSRPTPRAWPSATSRPPTSD